MANDPTAIEIATLVVGAVTATVTTAYVALTYGLLWAARRQVQYTHMPALAARVTRAGGHFTLAVENRSGSPAAQVEIGVYLTVIANEDVIKNFVDTLVSPEHQEKVAEQLGTAQETLVVRETVYYPSVPARRGVDNELAMPDIGFTLLVWIQYLGPTGAAYGQALTFLDDAHGNLRLADACPPLPQSQSKVRTIVQYRTPFVWRIARRLHLSDTWWRHTQDVSHRGRLPRYVRGTPDLFNAIRGRPVPVGLLRGAHLDWTDRGDWRDV